MRLMILNGPNLNLLGLREPHIYGRTTLAAIQASCEEFAKFADAQLSFHQSNHEGVLVSPAVGATRGRCNHHQSRRLFVHVGRDLRRAQDFRRSDFRSAHFEHPCARRIASSFEALGRRHRGDRRPWSIRLHCRHAGRTAGAWDIAAHSSSSSSHGPTVKGVSAISAAMSHRSR